MIWYIFTLIFSLAGSISIPADNGLTIAFFIFAGIFLFVSICVTLSCISLQKRDIISLKQKEIEIKNIMKQLNFVKKEYTEKGINILNHELEIIKNLGFSVKNIPSPSSDNILSHNLLAQLPDLKALSIIQDFLYRTNKLEQSVIDKINYYNETITFIKKRQENPLIYSFFIPKYNIPFMRWNEE